MSHDEELLMGIALGIEMPLYKINFDYFYENLYTV
jgi:hypothetical protein